MYTSITTSSYAVIMHHRVTELAPIFSFGTASSIRSHSPLKALISQLFNSVVSVLARYSFPTFASRR